VNGLTGEFFLDFFRLPQKRPDRRHPVLFAVPDLSMLLDQAKTQEKFLDRCFGKRPDPSIRRFLFAA